MYASSWYARSAGVIFVAAAIQTQAVTVSILVDLDPASVGRSVIIESMTADTKGRLYVPDRVTGNILRVDPSSPAPFVVGRIAERTIRGKAVAPNPGGIAFDSRGDLFVATGPFAEVVRIKGTDLDPEKPGLAETFATGTEGANGIVFDQQGNLFVSGGRSGKVYRVGPDGGAASTVVEIATFARELPEGGEQRNVANGLAFDGKGVLYIADTARGAIWTSAKQSDGAWGAPAMLVKSPLLEGVDGITFDRDGILWAAVNERNALVTVTTAGRVQEVAKNGSRGPLEFPAAIVFVGGTGYVCNFDTPRRDNLAADGRTSTDGIGASIAQFAR